MADLRTELTEIVTGTNICALTVAGVVPTLRPPTVTAAPGYPELATKYLSELTGTTFILAGDLIEATSDTGAYVLLSGAVSYTHLTLPTSDLV